MISLPLPDPVTPDWLTEVLHRAGGLKRGAVQAVEQEPTGAFNSSTSRLLLRYSADATPGAPTRLILKRNISAAWGVEAGAEEVKFYTLVADLPDHPSVIVPCYAAAYDAESGNSYLLLQDMSATHQPPVTRDQQISLVDGVPPAGAIASVVEALAGLHAYWWEHPLLETDTFVVGYWSRTAERFEQYWHKRTTSWNRLMGAEGAWFPDDLRTLYEQVLAGLPAHWERYLAPRFQARRHLTLIHGDAYFANFLCPQPAPRPRRLGNRRYALPRVGMVADAAAPPPPVGKPALRPTPRRHSGRRHSPTYLLDWQSPGFDLGGYDLANLCATFWTPEQRREDQREETTLRRYHATLQARGVKHYTWENLLTDYQLGLIFWLLMPVQDAADGSRKAYWWPKMQCLVAAFRDWQCGKLLGMERN